MNAQPHALHATYAPSSAHRWTVCTASAAAISTLGEQEEGAAAKKGTAAHEELERVLGGGEPDADHASSYAVALAIAYIAGLPKGEMWVEERVRLSDQIWGRCDVAHWHAESETLTIVDLKDGFVGVDAEENEQLRIYAAASIATHKLPAKWIRLVVVQPNDFRPLPRVKQALESAADLDAWAQGVSEIPNGPLTFKAGDHCRYCPLFGRCEATRDLLGQLAVMLQHTPEEIRPDQVALVSALKRPIEDWFKSLDKAATKAALAGSVPDGMKLVTSVKHRSWNDEAAARREIVSHLGVEALSPPTPAQAEKLGMDKAAVATLADTPDGGPALAFASDKRKPWTPKTVESMFAGVAANLAK